MKDYALKINGHNYDVRIDDVNESSTLAHVVVNGTAYEVEIAGAKGAATKRPQVAPAPREADSAKITPATAAPAPRIAPVTPYSESYHHYRGPPRAQRQGQALPHSCRAALPASRCGAGGAESPAQGYGDPGWAVRLHRPRHRHPVPAALPAPQSNPRPGSPLLPGRWSNPPCGGTPPTAGAAAPHKTPG